MSKRRPTTDAAEPAPPPKNSRRERRESSLLSLIQGKRATMGKRDEADGEGSPTPENRTSQQGTGFLREALALTLFVLAVLVGLALFTYNPEKNADTVALTGKVGAFLADGLLQVFGHASYLFVGFLFWLSLWLWLNRALRLRMADVAGAFGVVVSAAVLIQLSLAPGEHLWQVGGVVGALLVKGITPLLGMVGLTLLALLVLLLSFTLAAGLRPKQVIHAVSRWAAWLGLATGRLTARLYRRLREARQASRDKAAEAKAESPAAVEVPAPLPAAKEPDIVTSTFQTMPMEEDAEDEDEAQLVDGVAPRQGDVVVVIRKRRSEPDLPDDEPRLPASVDFMDDEEDDASPLEPFGSSDENTDDDTDGTYEEASEDQAAAFITEQARPRRAKQPKDGLEIQNVAKGLDERELEKRAAQAEKEARAERREYEFPSLRFLDYKPPENEDLDRERLTANARKLEETLRSFKIDGEVTKIQQGPVITMYEYKPVSGIKISKIANLEDDLAMALKALKIRIVAPLPGKGTVGIEVPNENPQMVYLKEILSQDEFVKAKSKLPMGLGKNIFGRPVVVDLTKMPHMIVAGATGQGKSVAVNNMILSLLYHFDPDDLKFILIDPKMLEFSMYEGIAHLLLPVVTDVKQSSLALGWAVAEMERRYQMLMEWGVKNISNFNALVKRVEGLRAELMDAKEKGIDYIPDGDESDPNSDAALLVKIFDRPALRKLPYIVVIIDELADLMAQVRADVEVSIARLAAKARAAGIHLILATQRPSTDVITGVIKNNFPARMSLKVTGMQDSRTVIDHKGAEQLLGRGDSLLMMPGQADLLRVQSAYVSEEEIERIVHHIRKQRPADERQQEKILESLRQAEEQKDVDDVSLSGDNLYDQAIQLVCETKNASISMIQRKLRIGYNRAARMIEQMEEDGIVGQADHQNKRQVFGRPSPM